MIISQSGIVDIIPEYNRQLRPIFCVSEGDKNTRMINITVQQAGENFSIPSGASVYVTGKKQDNTIFTYQCTKSGYIVSFQIAEQMSAANGIVLCELQIIENGNPLGSANFVYWVEPSPVQNGTASESDLNVFLEAIIGADKLDHFWANVEETVAEAVEAIQIHEGQTVIDASLSVSGAAADAKATGDIVRAFMDALVTESTAEAAIATCDDAAGGLPLKKLTANIEPTQAGTGDPSPDNVRPISGYDSLTVSRSAKNLIPYPYSVGEQTVAGVAFTYGTDGSVRAVGTPTQNLYKVLHGGFATNKVPVPSYMKKGVSYTISSGIDNPTAGNHFEVVFYDAEGASRVYRDASFTVPESAVYYGLFIRILHNFGAVNETFYPMIRLASDTDETFEPYNGATYPVTFPTEAGTVYGGTLIVNSDGSGALTVDRAAVDLGTLNWSVVTGNNYATFSSLTALSDAAYSASTPNILCSIYKPDANNTVSPTVDNNIWLNPQKVIRIKDTSKVGMTADEFKTAVTGQTLVYTLATHTTYALSAVEVVQMLAGLNNIWTDAAGTLTTEYYASTGLYVEKKVNAQRNMIAGVEEAMIATKNYSVNDLLIVGNTLYKVTAAISSGAALVVGTNVTETTVAEQLLALA